MDNRLKFRLASLAVSILLLFVFLLVALGPFISLYQIKNGIENKNEARLELFIDFPLLQENVKQKLRLQASEALGFEGLDQNNMMASFAMQIADQIVNITVDNILTPKGLSLLLSGADLNEVVSEKGEQNRSGNAKGQVDIKSLWQQTEINFESHDQAIVVSHLDALTSGETDEREAVRMVFYRYGLIWKLGDIEMGQ